MRIKRILASLLLLCMLPCMALAEGSVINLISDPDAEYSFKEGAQLLEVVFPRVHSSDCAVLRFGDEVMMIDASHAGEGMQKRIKSALEAMGVTHINTAFNSHPHNDHIDGFSVVYETAPFDQFVITFPEDYDKHIKAAVRFAQEKDVVISHASDGDMLSMGSSNEVTLNVIQRDGKSWTDNDRSAMLKVQYGKRSILFTGDIEGRAQKSYAAEPPACGLDVDILKYPHHGIGRIDLNLLDMISPEITLINGGKDSGETGREFMKKKRLPFLVGYKGLTRMRTDGEIWVIDYLDEIVTDR